jgi:pimeloyl-ACP methyl ester carboxylesterase
MSTVKVGGRDLHAARRGSGPPLLLLAGMSANHAFWPEELLAALEPHLELILYDHRGTGASGREREAFTLAELAGTPPGRSRSSTCRAPRARVLARRDGGAGARARPPEAVDRLVLAGTSPGGPRRRRSPRSASPRCARPWPSTTSSARCARPGRRTCRRTSRRRGGVRALGAGRRAHPMAMRTLEHQLAAARAHHAAGRLDRLAAPTLVLHGQADELLPAANAELLAATVPGARLELLAGAGHFFAWEQPERTAELVLDFLQVAR